MARKSALSTLKPESSSAFPLPALQRQVVPSWLPVCMALPQDAPRRGARYPLSGLT